MHFRFLQLNNISYQTLEAHLFCTVRVPACKHFKSLWKHGFTPGLGYNSCGVSVGFPHPRNMLGLLFFPPLVSIFFSFCFTLLKDKSPKDVWVFGNHELQKYETP